MPRLITDQNDRFHFDTPPTWGKVARTIARLTQMPRSKTLRDRHCCLANRIGSNGCWILWFVGSHSGPDRRRQVWDNRVANLEHLLKRKRSFPRDCLA